PSNVGNGNLPRELQLALYAYSPSLAATTSLPERAYCYDAVFVNSRTRSTPNERDTYASLRLTLRTQFRWTPGDAFRTARSVTYTWPETLIRKQCLTWKCEDPFSITALEELLDVWQYDWGSFVAFGVGADDPTLVAEVGTTTAAFLQGRQRALYALVGAGIQNAGTALNAAVHDMNLAARQLQAFTRLGFPVALAA